MIVAEGLDKSYTSGGRPLPVLREVDLDILELRVDPRAYLDLDTDVAETVYFIANEAIANVLKHARARVASVHVTRIAANVRITVHDDGTTGMVPVELGAFADGWVQVTGEVAEGAEVVVPRD